MFKYFQNNQFRLLDILKKKDYRTANPSMKRELELWDTTSITVEMDHSIGLQPDFRVLSFHG